LQWNQKQSALNSSIYLNTKVLDQITSNRFGSLNLGTTVSTTGTVTSAANTFSDVSLVLLGIPPLAMLTNGGDRPIGLVESDPNQNALTNTAVVLTREIIETALSGSVPAPYTYGPYLTIPFQKPGIMAIPFTDSTSTPGAMYVMTVQVERCDGSLLQYCAD
jgi:hypothetical protein